MLPINVFDQNMQSTGRFGFGAARAYVAAGAVNQDRYMAEFTLDRGYNFAPVSYTHLTLPTICSV